MSNNDTTDLLRRELEKLGAREFEHVALSMDAHRGLAAITYALEKGVDHPISYAIAVFDNPDWSPTSERPRRATNQAVEVTCGVCQGDRFIVHATRSPASTGWMAARGISAGEGLLEEMKPCPQCNPNANTGFFRADGTRAVTPK